jgi:hypothetical protein
MSESVMLFSCFTLILFASGLDHLQGIWSFIFWMILFLIDMDPCSFVASSISVPTL